MSNTDLIIPERSSDIGSFIVGRILPFREKRIVGPFIFIDHMGPSMVAPEHYLDVGQHPHIGLSTLTYLFEGEILHRDSIGSVQKITPGSVNWMTAGKGVVHTERTPEELRNGNQHRIHGYQIWVALPANREDMEPEFYHVAAEGLPRWKKKGLNITLVAGSAFGKSSAVPVYSPLFMLDLEAEADRVFEYDESLFGELGISVVSGSIKACGQTIEAGNMLVAKELKNCGFELTKGSRVLVFGGEAFPEPRFIEWNFVATSQEKLAHARQNWKDRRFTMVPGEHDYIPLPPILLQKTS
jgi:redox-sensitive bicupin YhaK (pirin superfamily)